MATSTSSTLHDKMKQLSFIASHTLLNKAQPQDITKGLQLIQELEHLQILQSASANAFVFYKNIIENQTQIEEISRFFPRSD